MYVYTQAYICASKGIFLNGHPMHGTFDSLLHGKNWKCSVKTSSVNPPPPLGGVGKTLIYGTDRQTHSMTPMNTVPGARWSYARGA